MSTGLGPKITPRRVVGMDARIQKRLTTLVVHPTDLVEEIHIEYYGTTDYFSASGIL